MRRSSVGNGIDVIDYERLAFALKELSMLSRIVFRSACRVGVSSTDIRFSNFMQKDIEYTASAFSFIGGRGAMG